MDPFPALGFLISAVIITFFFISRLAYLMDIDITDTKDERKDIPFGCFLFLCFVVGIPALFFGEWLSYKGTLPDGDGDMFGLKWFFIIMGGISALLILACIIKALCKQCSE